MEWVSPILLPRFSRFPSKMIQEAPKSKAKISHSPYHLPLFPPLGITSTSGLVLSLRLQEVCLRGLHPCPRPSKWSPEVPVGWVGYGGPGPLVGMMIVTWSREFCGYCMSCWIVPSPSWRLGIDQLQSKAAVLSTLAFKNRPVSWSFTKKRRKHSKYCVLLTILAELENRHLGS